MPRLIEEARENILAAAKRQLLEGGWQGMTIRSVADECGMAAGTVYNYFKSKETLVANVMLADWLRSLEKMRKACARATSLKGGLFAVYREIRAFSDYYSPLWTSERAMGLSQGIWWRGHKRLMRQIAEILHPLFLHFGCSTDAYLETFVAGSLISASVEEQPFDLYAALIKRILDTKV